MPIAFNRAPYQGTTFILHKNGIPVARITPEERKAVNGSELAARLREALSDVHIGAEEAAAWERDLEDARKNAALPVDKWRS